MYSVFINKRLTNMTNLVKYFTHFNIDTSGIIEIFWNYMKHNDFQKLILYFMQLKPKDILVFYLFS